MLVEKRIRREGNEDASEALTRARRLPWGSAITAPPRRAGGGWWLFLVRSAG
jgi:hypothetical protein